VLAAQNNADIYLVFEFMESDLYHLLYESKLQQVHVKYILYQILLGLHYLHRNQLIHRDLKPSNVLVNCDCTAKICDFGLVRYLGSDIVNYNTLTEGVATRWYRAP
jgi:mitogen-activated protein kinase 15